MLTPATTWRAVSRATARLRLVCGVAEHVGEDEHAVSPVDPAHGRRDAARGCPRGPSVGPLVTASIASAVPEHALEGLHHRLAEPPVPDHDDPDHRARS